MIEIPLIALIILPFIGAFISRMCGGLKPKLPRPLDQTLYSIPYIALPHILGFSALWIILSSATAIFGKITGHGQWMDLATWLRRVTPERLDFIVEWFFGKDPNVTQTTEYQRGDFWRDFFGLFVVGAAVPLGLSIALAFHGMFLEALIVFFGGGFKSISYTVGWKLGVVEEVKELDEPTEVGEALTGFFGWGTLALIYYLMI